jgi:eukaryotic-like serine/threonine-protein kinase
MQGTSEAEPHQTCSPVSGAASLALESASRKLDANGATPGTRLGHYEIVGLLGAGGMGEVHRARDSKLNRDVAIKLLSTPPSHTMPIA